MDRRQFILTALRESQVYYRSGWVFSLLTVVRNNEVEKQTNPYPYQIGVMNEKYAYFLNDTWHEITDSPDIYRPLWTVEETIEIASKEDIVQNAASFPFKTRIGNLIINYYCLVSVFGDRVDYINGKIDIGKLEKQLADRVVDADKSTRPGWDILPEELIKFTSAVTAMAGFSSIASPSATKYTMQPAPGIKEYREKLLKEYEGRLDDPAIIAEIDKKLVDFDKAHQAKDPEGGFYIAEKAFNVSRKKLFVMGGLEQPEISGGKKTLIKTSLSEGWDIDNLPAMINSMRDGSYNRGAMTALGGEAVKFIFRIFSATRIEEEDCGTTLGRPIVLRENNVGFYKGNTIILADGKQVTLDGKNHLPYLNQSVMVRSPGLCKTKHSSFCLKCLGEQLRGNENSLAALASEVGSKMLDIFMAKMHGTALVTTKWNYKETIK